MKRQRARRVTAVVTGAAGQDGSLLVQRLCAEGVRVHAIVREPSRLSPAVAGLDLSVHAVDLVDVESLARLIATLRPDEVYNLGGVSSVAASFEDPWTTWETNARPVVAMLQAIRDSSPMTRFYQASSSEMFGSLPGGAAVRDERSVLAPQSPYAAAKAAAHLACGAFRRAFGVRVACGITFNHESPARPPHFLTRKVVDHVRRLRIGWSTSEEVWAPLVMGNLAARRDWGYAPDYVDGILRVARQIVTRAEIGGRAPEGDTAENYRDYVLATGHSHAVWELVDRAFVLAGFELVWSIEGDPQAWSARFSGSQRLAVVVDPTLLRPEDPSEIVGDPGRARRELGWEPTLGLDAFLAPMLNAAP